MTTDFLPVLDSCRDVYKLFTYDTQYIALDMDIFKRGVITDVSVFHVDHRGGVRLGWGWWWWPNS